MDIERIGKPEPSAGIPIISFAAIHGGIVYLCGMTANPAGPLGDVKQQTREVLGQIDAALRAAGTDKSKLLTAQVWLTDMDDFADHNDAWNEWVCGASAGSCMRAIASAVEAGSAGRDYGDSGEVMLAYAASPPNKRLQLTRCHAVSSVR